ncbi:MAG: DNA-directed RNA polymerase subunit beta, partial [Clostridia bacterium]
MSLNIHTVKYGEHERKSFAKTKEIIPVPNLIEVQTESYANFVKDGIKEVFEDFSPIEDFAGHFRLEFLEHSLDARPKYSESECRMRDATYASPLKIKVRLIKKTDGSVIDQDVFIGDFPLMTKTGSFIINGAERVIVSQLVRSPGVYADSNKDKNNHSQYDTTVIPTRGAWLEFVHDGLNDILSVHVDRNRKLPATVLLRGIGLSSNEQLLNMFNNDPTIAATIAKDTSSNQREALIELYKRLRPGEIPTDESVKKQLDDLFFDRKRYDLARVGRYKFNKKLSLAFRIAGHTLAEDIKTEFGVVYKAGSILTEEQSKDIQHSGVNIVFLNIKGEKIKVIGNNVVDMNYFMPRFAKEYAGINFRDYGIFDYANYSVLKDILGLGLSVSDTLIKIKVSKDDLIPKHITREDIIATVSYNVNLKYGIGVIDNIDHLANRRVRSVGELLQNQFRIGISRLERVIRERMAIQEVDKATPQSLMNVRPVSSAIKEFFGSS